ncbi:MAG: tetratricopeptide repeat protein [Candidatus Sulfotelmatobacter sp.]
MEYFNQQLAKKDTKILDALKEAGAWRDKYVELTRRLAEAGTNTGLSLKAGELLQQGKLDEAGKLLDQAINSEESDLDRLAADQYSRGVLYALQFQPSQSLEHLEKAYRYRPDDPGYGNAYADMLKHENKLQESALVYEQVLTKLRHLEDDKPGQFDSRIAGALCNLGNAYTSLRQYAKAEKALKESLQMYSRLAPADPKAFAEGRAITLWGLGDLYADTGRYAEAEEALGEAAPIYKGLAAVNPACRNSYGAVLNNLARAYMSGGNFSAAKPLLEESLATMSQPGQKMDAGMVRALGNLGLVYAYMGQLSKGQEKLEEALGIWRGLASADRQLIGPIFTEPSSTSASFIDKSGTTPTPPSRRPSRAADPSRGATQAFIGRSSPPF